MALKSCVESANGNPNFPLENLPLGRLNWRGEIHRGVAIGDFVFLESDREVARKLLRDDAPSRDESRLIKQTDVEMLLPVDIGDYTDFYASIHHATNVGSMFRPDNPLLPNYKHIPIGYHGRASSIVISGTPFHRPKGQTRDDPNQPPQFGPTRRLDYEMEVRSIAPKITFLDFVSSMTGRRATFRRGSTSPSVHSSQKISRHRCRRGSSRSTHSRRFARTSNAMSIRFHISRNQAKADSTSRSKSGSAPRRCASR